MHTFGVRAWLGLLSRGQSLSVSSCIQQINQGVAARESEVLLRPMWLLQRL